MAWEGSNRKDRLPDDWEQIRRAVLRRDGHRCTWRLPSGARCPKRATDVDHKRAMEDDHRPEALQSLCAHHHAKKSALEGVAFRRKRQASRRRPPEEHPGTVR